MATNIGTLMATIGVDTRPLKKGLKDAERQTQTSTKKMLGHWKTIATGIAATYAIYKTVNLIKETALLAARFETLGIVMETVGKNAGYSAEQMERYDLALRETGISMIESRQSLARMAMAQLDLNKATELGRIAQDAAVIGNINSSEAFERMIYGIQSGNLVVLKTIGINVSFEESYKKVANTVGRTTESFSQTEKALIRQNAVLEYGGRIAGTYEAAMTTAGKKLTSFTRYIDDFKVKMGLAFGPATVMLVDAATDAMKEMQEEISKPEAQEALRNLSTQLATTITQLGKDLPKAIEKTTSAIANLQALYNALPDGVIGATGVGLVGRMLFGSTTGGALAAGLYLINTQMKQIDTGIWEDTEVKWGLGEIVKDYQDFADAIFKISDEMAGRTIKGVPVEPLVKRFKITMPDESLPDKDKGKDEDWMDQFRIKNELRMKDMQAQEAFAIKMATVEQARLNERYELEQEINTKIRGELLSDTEFKLQQLDAQFLAYDGLVKDKAVLDAWYMSEYKKITKADEGYQEGLALEEKFNEEYAEIGKSRFDLERDQLARQVELWKNAGIEKNKIDSFVSAKSIDIANAEQQAKLAIYSNMAGQIAGTFMQIAQAGGKQSKEAFRAYQVFAIAQAGIAATMAVLNTLASPLLPPPTNVVMAGIIGAMAMVQVAMIKNAQPPSYDRGGISNARGIYQTGDIEEAHIPLQSGKVPVSINGKSEKRPDVNIILNNPVFQDIETQRQVMTQIAQVVAAQVAPGAVVSNYENDGEIRQMVRGGI